MQTIKEKLDEMIEQGRKIISKSIELGKETEKIKKSTELSDVGIKTRIEEKKNSFTDECLKIYKSINEITENLLIYIPEKINSFDINDKELYNFINIINAVNGNVGERILNDLITKYNRQNVPLELLKNVFLNYKKEKEAIIIEKAKINLKMILQELRSVDTGFYFCTSATNPTGCDGVIKKIYDIAQLLRIELNSNYVDDAHTAIFKGNDDAMKNINVITNC